MHCETFGSGSEPLVCLHGWGCRGGQFAGLAELLGRDFRIHMPDLPGHGRTPLRDFKPGFESYAGAVTKFISDLGVKRPVLLGHSMGGVLALMAATRLEVRAVINLDGSLPAAAHTLTAQDTLRSWLDEPDFRSRLAGALREGFFLPHERDAQCETIIREMCSAPEAVLRFLPTQVHALLPQDILPRVAAPVLYIGAAKPRFDAEAAAVMVRDARFQKISTAGHFLHLYAPAEVSSLVIPFLAGHK